jgi:hypothetical protein
VLLRFTSLRILRGQFLLLKQPQFINRSPIVRLKLQNNPQRGQHGPDFVFCPSQLIPKSVVGFNEVTIGIFSPYKYVVAFGLKVIGIRLTGTRFMPLNNA